MNKRLLSILVLIISAHTATASAEASVQKQQSLTVELLGTGKVLSFDQPARLDNVLNLSQEQQVILQYPLAVTLFDNSDSAKRKVSALKSSVLNQMIQHNLVAHPLYKFIQESQFSPRVLSHVDLDKVRLDKFENPLLKGKLALSAPKREEKVLYIGNIDKVYAITNQAGISIHNQINNLQNSVIGKLGLPPILIYPDGKVTPVHHGNWLTKQYYLPPLTLVYVPFKEFEHSKFDQDIVKLLTQRKPTLSKNTK